MIRSRPILFLSPLMAIGLSQPAADLAHAQAVVQPLPDAARDDLNSALRRLSRNPNSLSALIDAGRASLALGDITAALGFFNRAQTVDPDDGRVLTGLAQIAVWRGEAVTAIRLFDNAERAGTSMMTYASDRGLAYDLVGQHARAQRLYRQSLSRREDNETVRRLALSYAISGDGAASEATLLPLLQRQDRAAYRTRAFALAILGRDEEAIAIAETMLPPRLSGRLAPYLRYMPQLTAAQQAAAANLGRFPATSQIGRDTAQIAALSQGAVAPPASGSDRLTPAGEPLGPADAAGGQAALGGELPAIATTETSNTRPQSSTQVPPPQLAEPVAQPAPAAAGPSSRPEAVVVLSEPAQFPDENESRPSFSISEVASATPDQPSEERLELSEAFADFTLPGERLPVAASDGAVDIRTIEPAREAAPQPAPPPPPAHPSRHWVQVATGQDVAAFRFDWRRIVRNANGLLDDHQAYTAPWNATNRLVTGPFESSRAAQQFVSELAEAGISAFRFTSAEGEEVRPLN